MRGEAKLQNNYLEIAKYNGLGIVLVLACIIMLWLSWLIAPQGAADSIALRLTYHSAIFLAFLGTLGALFITLKKISKALPTSNDIDSLIFCASVTTVLFSYSVIWHLENQYFQYGYLLILFPICLVSAYQAALWSAPVAEKTDTFPNISKKAFTWLVPILLVSLLIFIISTIVSLRIVRFEDLFITLRYGWNLAQGSGINWNASDPIPSEGYTTFVWVLLSAFFFASHLDPVLGTQIANLFTLGLLSFFMWHLFQDIYHHRRAASFLPIAILIAFPATAFHIASGMETLFYAATLAGISSFAVKAFQEKYTNKKHLFFLGGSILLSGLTRPDGVIYGVIVLVVLVWLSRREFLQWANLWPLFLTLVGPGIIYFAWRLIYFQQLLPLSFYHKSFVGDLYGHATRSVLFTDFVGLILLPFILFILFRVFSRTLPKEAYLVLIPAVILVLYYSRVLAVAGLQYRFFYPYLFAFVLIAANDFVNLLNYATTTINSVLVPFISVLFICFICLSSFFYEARNTFTFFQRGLTYDESTDEYMRIGKTLLNISPSEPIGIGEVGKIGMLLKDYEVIDITGLNDRYLARHPFSIEYLNERKVNILITFAYPRAPLGVYADVYRKVGEAFEAIENEFTCIGNIRGFDVFVRRSQEYPELFAQSLNHSVDFDQGICLSNTSARWGSNLLILELLNWSFWDMTPEDAGAAEMNFVVTGNDPVFLSEALDIQAEDYDNVIMKVRLPANIECNTLTLYFTTTEFPTESEDRSMYIQFEPSNEFQNIVANVKANPNWRGTISTLRVDPVCGLNSDGSEIKIGIKGITLQ